MELPGKKASYLPEQWPYLTAIPTGAIQQQLHFPIDIRHLTSMYRTLGDFDKSSHKAAVTLITLQLIAEAVTNTLRYRGEQHGSLWLGKNPRVTILLSYITRDLWENEQERQGKFQIKDLLTEDNIVGLMFSVIVLDDDLNLADAVADQLKINVFGHPKIRKKVPGAPEDEDEDDAMDLDGRLDVPGRPLDARGSRYYYLKNRDGTSRLEPHIRYSKATDQMYRVISNNEAYVRLGCMFFARVQSSLDAFTLKSDDYRLSQLPHNSPFLPENAFTLDAALRKFAEWGANPVFCDRNCWINTWRALDDHTETFGPPYWRAGETAAQVAYNAGTAECMAYYDPDLFNAYALMNYCLPHVELTDAGLLRPNSRREKSTVQAGEHSFVLEDYLGVLNYQTVAEQIRTDKKKDLNEDIFNDYFERMAPVASDTDELLRNTKEPSPEYIDRLSRMQRQGMAWFKSVMDPNTPKLPEGYRALQLHIWDRVDWSPTYDRMWQTGAVAMTPFAQMKVRDLVLDDGLIKVPDNTLLLKSRMMRSIYTIYLPRIGKLQNKEHSQYVGTPGTSKSHSLLCIVALLIPDTYATKSGGSMMGIIGELCSQRLLILYQEIPNLMAPDGDYRGDSDKYLGMKLTQLGDGVSQYSTTREVTLANGDKVRQGFSTTAEYTNVVLGARNVKYVNATKGGSVEAMYDRFTIIQQRQIVAKGRVNLIHRVLEANRNEMSSGLRKLQEQYHLIHRAIMEYGALICSYAVPLPDLSLFTVLAPLAVSYLAQLRPELHFQLRNIGRIKTRMYIEVMLFAIRMALTTPLNPTRETIIKDDGKPTLKFAPYKTEESMREIQKYAYSTLDQIVYVLTEAMYELTTAESFTITQAFVETYSDYFSMGQKKSDTRPDDERRRWPGPQPEEIAKNSPMHAGMQQFITRLKGDGVYMLQKPTGAHISRMRNSMGKHGHEAQYSNYELTEVKIEEEYEDLFLLNAAQTEHHFKLDRSKAPKYKREHIVNVEYINPNYVTIKSDINTFAQLVAGRIGEYQLSEAAVKGLLHDLQRKTIVAAYLPSITTGGVLHSTALNEIQSLRYIRDAMKEFPKYKVPVLINNPHEGEFYVLISYFETNPYEVVNNMINHISYESTFRRRSVMGIPSQLHCLHYEPVEIAPIPDKKLTVARKSNINPATYKLLEDYTDGMLDELNYHDQVWSKVDMEEFYAMEYLRRYNPIAGEETLKQYTPRGIWDRLYNKDTGYYRGLREREESLLNEPYPEVFTKFEVAADKDDGAPPQPMDYDGEPAMLLGKRPDVEALHSAAKRRKDNEYSGAGIGQLDIEGHDWEMC